MNGSMREPRGASRRRKGMTRPSPRLLATLLAGALALGPLAACGSSGSEPVASDGGAASTTAAPSTTADPDASRSSPGSPGDPTATTLAPTDPGATVDTELPPPVSIEEAQVLVGMTVEGAFDEAEARGWTLRIVRSGDDDLPVTDDYSPTRVNIAAEIQTVTEVVSVG